MNKWFTVFQETCGCNGVPKEKIRLFALGAFSEEDARRQANLRVTPGTVLIIEEIAPPA